MCTDYAAPEIVLRCTDVHSAEGRIAHFGNTVEHVLALYSRTEVVLAVDCCSSRLTMGASVRWSDHSHAQEVAVVLDVHGD